MIFSSEQELVSTFVSTVDKNQWKIYPETGDFDLLLVRQEDGFQIGIEAKLRLNMKVVSQAADLTRGKLSAVAPGPDCRAVLVPQTKQRSEFHALLEVLQIVVIRIGGRKDQPWCSRALPRLTGYQSDWPEHFPHERIALPDYVPDVSAGVRGPTKLTLWKVKAIKLVVLLRRRGYLVRRDFARLECSPSVWTQRRWIVPSEVRGQWIEGAGIPDFKSQHPVNFEEIERDFESWNYRDLEGIL